MYLAALVVLFIFFFYRISSYIIEGNYSKVCAVELCCIVYVNVLFPVASMLVKQLAVAIADS